MVEGTIRNKPERIELALHAQRHASEMWRHDDGSVTFEFPLAGLPSIMWSRVFDEVRRQQHDVSEARLELDGPTVCVRSQNTDRAHALTAARVHVALTNLRLAQAVVSIDPQCRQGWRGPLPTAAAIK